MGAPRERGLRRAVLALSLLGASSLNDAAHAQARHIERIDYVVTDARRAALFYEHALGFARESELDAAGPAAAGIDGLGSVQVRTITLRLGDDRIGLIQYFDPVKGRPWPAGSRSQDRWFQHFAIVVSDMSQAYTRLSAFAPQAISRDGPQTLPLSTGPVTAFKFRDPDGHPLELLRLPPGAGRPAWQHPTGPEVFLGIDHTTIGVKDTASSLVFYHDLLGLRVVGGVLNQGAEQERLDDVPAASVRITPVRPQEDAGPGVEFIQYLRPSDGRDAPADSHPTDLWASRIELAVDDLDELATKLSDAGVRLESPGVVPLPGQTSGKALTVLDPDGHRVLLLQH